MAKSKDLFDDTTMTFGEHLEVLRAHSIKALLGLAVTLAITLTWGNRLVDLIRNPIDKALKRNAILQEDDVKGFDFWSTVKGWVGMGDAPPPVSDDAGKNSPPLSPNDATELVVKVRPSALASILHQADPKRFADIPPPENEAPVPLIIAAKEFREFRQTTDEMHRPITLNVQEAFLMYIKVALIGGVILASPWILYQVWQFIAAGLYPHERRYVHVYLPMSIGLFLFGAVFAFYAALPLVLDFLLSYNRWLGVVAQIRLSEWVSFVIILPLMFGVSFQLPLIMLFLERINVFTVSVYRERRRLAIFAMAVLAMVLSPGGDPGTMMLMFIPLVLLYELGIILCGVSLTKRPFEEPGHELASY